jgi:hypothetical protein
VDTVFEVDAKCACDSGELALIDGLLLFLRSWASVTGLAAFLRPGTAEDDARKNELWMKLVTHAMFAARTIDDGCDRTAQLPRRCICDRTRTFFPVGWMSWIRTRAALMLLGRNSRLLVVGHAPGLIASFLTKK